MRMPRIRLYDLRHTYVTLLFNDGQNFKIISQRLGHRDMGIAPSIYVCLAPDAQNEASEGIDGPIFGSR